MSYLLDTHVWVWADVEPTKLSRKARRIIENSRGGLFLSSYSICEVACLQNLGRLNFQMPLADWVAATIASMNLVVMDVGAKIAMEAWSLPEPFHRDPADRIIVATARLAAATVLTADRQILRYKHVKSAW